jgi:hypothetical protein
VVGFHIPFLFTYKNFLLREMSKKATPQHQQAEIANLQRRNVASVIYMVDNTRGVSNFFVRLSGRYLWQAI